jgi:hypothetical protein
MSETITIAPVRKTIRVKASAAHAFEVFTAGLGRWWPLDHGIGKTPRKGVVMETHLADATRVELEHRKFEQLGVEGGNKVRKDVDGGWPGLLERFKNQVEAA